MSKAQAIRIAELEEQLCRVLSAGLKQQEEIARLTAAVETWRVEAATHRRDKDKLRQELADYQANVSESMDRTTAYEAELKADRDHWRKLCQDGWVEVADGPVSRKLREDLASFMMSRGFATGHGDSHTDLLGELGPQIDDLRARLAEAEKDAGCCKWTDDETGNYDTDCSNTFAIIDGTPAENQMQWCVYCGKRLIDAARGGA